MYGLPVVTNIILEKHLVLTISHYNIVDYWSRLSVKRNKEYD